MISVKLGDSIDDPAILDRLPEYSAVIDSELDISQKRGGRWCGYEQGPLTSSKLLKFGTVQVIYLASKPKQ